MRRKAISHESLRDLQRQSFEYFIHEFNPDNGLVADRSQKGSPASIAGVGLALSAYPVAVKRRLMRSSEAIDRAVNTLRFFRNSPQSKDPAATGYKGFYYHFLDMATGRRAKKCELSTIDTALFLAGVLTCAQYFQGGRPKEREIGRLATEIYERVDWQWALNRGLTVSHGWKPERGFIKYRWKGYCEALFLYILGLGSPTFPLPAKCYHAWTSTYEWKPVYDQEFLYAGPLFIHQFSHIWIDFRGIRDAYMRGKKIDYFENSRRATYAQQQYAVRNPRQFVGYDENCWGISASDGPGPTVRRVGGKRVRFYDYVARGVPNGPDDGTIAPWAAVASLPFAPEIVRSVLRHFEDIKLRAQSPYGFKATFNMTYPLRHAYWISSYHFALNQGPIILMIENFHSGLIWKLMRSCAPIISGLRRAGFKGGWLDSKAKAK